MTDPRSVTDNPHSTGVTDLSATTSHRMGPLKAETPEQKTREETPQQRARREDLVCQEARHRLRQSLERVSCDIGARYHWTRATLDRFMV
jgi:hypothetical protein